MDAFVHYGKTKPEWLAEPPFSNVLVNRVESATDIEGCVQESSVWVRLEPPKRAYEELCKANGKEHYVRHVIPGYGHMDCFIGRDAARVVYPIVMRELEKWN